MAYTISRSNIYTVLFDIIAILFIYLIPTISHLLNFPLYLFEPMRIVIFLSLAHFRKSNAYIIALTLPFFSFLISGHPVPLKVVLITLELGLNVFLFFQLLKVLKRTYASAFISILFSKIIYYLLKFSFISFAVFEGRLISTPIYIQLILTLVLVGYLTAISWHKKLST